MASITVGGDGKGSWFKEDNSDKANQEILQPANETLRGRDEFKQRVRRILGGKRGSHQVPTTREGLQQQIKELDPRQLGELADSALRVAGRAHSTYIKERATGAKKMGQRTQNFVRVFADFLGAYSGIVELVRGAGQQYGQLAYETLSLFLSVVVNKCNNDMKIADFLSELRKSFPQLDTLRKVYSPSTVLRERIVSVYNEVIIFARKATDYFVHFLVRFRMAIGKPPSMGIDITVATIHSKLAEVNSEAMVLLHSRSLEIGKGVQRLEADNKKKLGIIEKLSRELQEVKGQLQELSDENHLIRVNSDLKRQQEYQERLEEFKSTLGMQYQVLYPSLETELDPCHKSLSEAFPNAGTSPRKAAARYEQMTPDLLNEQKAYLDWQRSASSCLLLLSGTTEPDGRLTRGATYSWLSPAAIYIAKQVQNEKGLLVYYCCHPEVRSKIHHVADVMSSLVFQILRWKPEVLQQNHQRFRSTVRQWQRPGLEPTDRDAIRAMVQLLREVLTEVKTEGVVHIVIDRVEQCNCKIHHLMDELAKLVGEESCSVKIAAIIEGDEWDTSNLEEKPLAHVMKRVGWRQERILSVERRKLNAMAGDGESLNV
ncbi:MAG: hypothetical protein M1813_007590 [Trichoglossum hirsutum]|nr:MAG: hypothetical protein M1813_007590 [Trichoglossum hirsutum]